MAVEPRPQGLPEGEADGLVFSEGKGTLESFSLKLLRNLSTW